MIVKLLLTWALFAIPIFIGGLWEISKDEDDKEIRLKVLSVWLLIGYFITIYWIWSS